MKGANRQMRMLVMIFQKKICLGKWTIFGQKWCIVIILDPLYEFLKILHNEKGQQVDESNNNGLYQRFFFSRQMGYFGPENGAYPHNSESALRFLKKICRMKGAHRYMKISLVIFRKKNYLGRFHLFSIQAIFYYLIGDGQIEPGHWILKESGHDFFHDYYWIFKQSGHDQDS